MDIGNSLRQQGTEVDIEALIDALRTVYFGEVPKLTTEQAQGFYAVHKERPFYNDLVSYMTSGPVVVQVLSGDDAIAKNRAVMGATNPADAAPGTIRADFASEITENAVHGSDAAGTAATEIAFFFGDGGLCPRTR